MFNEHVSNEFTQLLQELNYPHLGVRGSTAIFSVNNRGTFLQWVFEHYDEHTDDFVQLLSDYGITTRDKAEKFMTTANKTSDEQIIRTLLKTISDLKRARQIQNVNLNEEVEDRLHDRVMGLEEEFKSGRDKFLAMMQSLGAEPMNEETMKKLHGKIKAENERLLAEIRELEVDDNLSEEKIDQELVKSDNELWEAQQSLILTYKRLPPAIERITNGLKQMVEERNGDFGGENEVSSEDVDLTEVKLNDVPSLGNTLKLLSIANKLSGDDVGNITKSMQVLSEELNKFRKVNELS